ncbi:MAG TPA: hypothetical protein VKT49_17335 [Bryobacteraceae bacterium]|nr:hypothetical protein [Bryobacteraceae bacterium]
MPLADTLSTSPALQAGRILEAFASGNEPLLHEELQKTRNLRRSLSPGLEEERFELLQALAEGMLRFRARLSEGRKDPGVRRCLDLLAHLAQTPSARGNAYRQSAWVM